MDYEIHARLANVDLQYIKPTNLRHIIGIQKLSLCFKAVRNMFIPLEKNGVSINKEPKNVALVNDTLFFRLVFILAIVLAC